LRLSGLNLLWRIPVQSARKLAMKMSNYSAPIQWRVRLRFALGIGRLSQSTFSVAGSEIVNRHGSRAAARRYPRGAAGV
jgi:hypothetical protein